MIRLTKGIAVLAALLVPLPAMAWLDPGWPARQPVTIASSVADADLSDFPYLVRIVDAGNALFATAQPNGQDIVFTAADGVTRLSHEIEFYDASAGELYAWVRVPLLSSTVDTDLFMYYGNGAAADQQDIEGTWDSDFVMVQHLQETAGTHVDSTTYDNDAAPQNGVDQNAAGRVDGADRFDGSNDFLDVPDDPSLRVVEMTVEAWVYVPGAIPGGFHGIAVHAPSTSNWYGLYHNGNRFHYRWSTGAVRRTDFSANFLPDRWYYVVGVLDVPNNRAVAYQDGAPDSTIAGPSLPTPTAGTTRIGSAFAGSERFGGFLDEVRISQVARSPEWIAATYRINTSPDTYLVLDPQETVSAISGVVFEDADFAGVPADYDGGVGDAAMPAVDVELYDNADTYLASVSSDASGQYTFAGLADGAYKVRARSATMGDADTPPRGTLNATVPGTWPFPLPEMTWGAGSAAVGGQDAAVDDSGTGDDAGPSDTWVAVTVAGSDVTGVNLGFAYNLVVDTGDDGAADNARSGQGSLRQFIKNANAIGTAGGTTAGNSQFAIPGAGPHAIAPVSALPVLDDPVTIDGYTQPGAQANTVPAPGVTDAVLRIELVGTAAGAGADGLEITAGGSAVRGLVINRFDGAAIALSGGAGNTVAGNYLGVDVTGLSGGIGNVIEGVRIALSTDNTVGGASPADRNVITGNRLRGIWIEDFSDGPGAASHRNRIVGNYIGVDAAGTAALPYSGGATPEYQQIGIAIWDSPDNEIGGAAAGEGNVISGNAWHGVYGFGANGTGNSVRGNVIGLDAAEAAPVPNGYESATRSAVLLTGLPGTIIGGVLAGQPNVIAGNASAGVRLNGANAADIALVSNVVYANVGLGVDLGSDGVTPNDGGDGDTGPNGLLNFPEIAWAGDGGGTILVDFDLDVPAGSYRVEFFRNPGGADPSGHGEGEVFAGATVVTHPGGGAQRYSTTVPGAQGDVLTATAIRCLDGVACTSFGSTSEFGASVTAVAGLAMVKGAYLPDGTLIATGSTIPEGLVFYYVLYLNNRGPARSDVSLQDVLDPAFAYEPGSIRTDNSVPACAAAACTPGEEAAIVAAALSGTAGTDAIDADALSYTAVSRTIDAGDGSAANAQLDIAANRVWALAFAVRMQ